MVLTLALAGLSLATLVAFTPWHVPEGQSAVVEVRIPLFDPPDAAAQSGVGR